MAAPVVTKPADDTVRPGGVLDPVWEKVSVPIWPVVTIEALKLGAPAVVVEPDSDPDDWVMVVSTVRVKLWAVVPTLLVASMVKV